MTLLLGPPGSGKTTLLLALAGKLSKDLKVRKPTLNDIINMAGFEEAFSCKSNLTSDYTAVFWKNHI